MKTNRLLALLLLSLQCAAGGQTLLWEDFNNGMEEWTSSGHFTDNWTINNSLNAGGSVPELRFVGTTQNNPNKTCRFISPVIDLTGYNNSGFSLFFKHKLARSGPTEIGIAVSTDGKEWEKVWHTTSAAEGLEKISIAAPETGMETFRFCFYFAGNLVSVKEWFIDDIRFFAVQDYEILLNDATVEKSNLTLGEGNKVSFSFDNIGSKEIHSMEVWYQVNDEEPVSEIKTGLNIASDDSHTMTFNQTIEKPAIGLYTVKIWVTRINNTVVTPEYMHTQFGVSGSISAQKMVMVEEFTSSTCAPCQQVNGWLNPLLNTNTDKCIVTKYQMNWPSDGDIYYTKEGGVRKEYYRVGGVPEIYIDGKKSYTDQYAIKDALSQAFAQKAEADIKGTFQITGTTIDVDAYVTSNIAGAYAIYISVNEKETTENVGTNGETKFHHVFMKMLPDVVDNTYELATGIPTPLSFQQDLSETHIEEYDDLEVAVFIQNYATKEILNACYLPQSATSFKPVSGLNGTLQYTTATTADVSLNWEASTPAPSGYHIYKDGEKIAENINTTTYKDANAGIGAYTYAVTAIYDGTESVYAATSIDIAQDIKAPSDVKADTEDYAVFEITWGASAEPDLQGYNIYRHGTRINDEPVKGTSYTDTPPYSGVYCYTVCTVTADGESPASNRACVAQPQPSAPKNIKVKQLEDETIKVQVTWDRATTFVVDGYSVYRNGIILNTDPITDVSYTDTPGSAGKYCYTVTAVAGEQESERPEEACIDITTGIAQTELNKLVHIYPNPAGDHLLIESRMTITHCCIYSISGRQVYSSATFQQPIPLHGWATGLYIIRLEDGQGNHLIKRFIKR